MQVAIEGSTDKELRIVTEIRNPKGKKVAYSESLLEDATAQSDTVYMRFTVRRPELWSPETPSLYTAHTNIYEGDLLTDSYITRFGIRSAEVVKGQGFYLNGELRKFKGVCNHHDLGPLGAAVNKAALRHQLEMLKDMGCDAIRTSHNMPAPELVELCDELGFMMMVEAFDEWDIAKCANGYHRHFEEWAEKDIVNMIRNFRNNPSVVMWSIGNEVPTQCDDQGYKVAAFLQDICHREDPSRLVTCGLDQPQCVLTNGFAEVMDVVGINYHTELYKKAFETLPQGNILGSETASTVSSRGVYKIPVELKYRAMYDDHQSSSYDVEYCPWSNIPDIDFALAEDFEWTMGQFVWTGFDYLGEPTPYGTDSWPNHSSLFGIIDLASIPKDRYYLYRSQWNENDHTLHLLPHWNWEGHEGETIPVMCYTDFPSAELFVNGVSQGVVSKAVIPLPISISHKLIKIL
jgi:beta-galactosidase